ncbi:uncharacterized protein F58A4.6 [Colletes gigas]|uniref:uncharacterized protein F58A4.6 n=1 Tax=Colletes gigas TaxID=935657 RepID=UPI001C9AD712|nr:uncharacterized protein F58A4.6 [Colletes gigas]
MDNSIKLIIHRGNTIFDSVIVTPYSAIRYEQKLREKNVIDRTDANINKCNENNIVEINRIRLNKRGYSAYLLSAYVVTIIKSQTYRRAVFRKLSQYLAYKFSNNINLAIILMKLRTPKKQFLDYNWNERITRMALERKEINHAMSCLSTLGGAFSALGDKFQHCAEVARKISTKQFILALRLEDPLMVARCKLYIALSLIQQGQLKISRNIVRSIYKFSIEKNDTRLQNMCLGIWAKLRYCYSMRKKQQTSIVIIK